jgi:hypothetical protein
MINGDSAATAGDLEYAQELMNFATAIASRDEEALAQSRRVLLDAAGWEVVVDAAAVAGNFQRMVRIADATGIPIDAKKLPLMNKAADELQLRRFASANNTPQITLGQRIIAPLMRKLAPAILKRLSKSSD